MRYLHQISSDKGFVDLHNHTNSSFGEEMNKTGITPVGLLQEAAEYANKHNAPVTFSVNDHNNTHGNVEVIEEMQRNPEKYKNINFIPGCEYTVSTASVGYVYDDKGNRKPVLDGKVHLLAYSFDLNDPVVQYLDLCMNTENKYMKRVKNTPVKNGSLVFATKKWLADQGFQAGIDEFSKNCPIVPDFDETEAGIKAFLQKKFNFNANQLQDWHNFVNDGQNLVRYAKADVQEVMAIIQKAGGYTVLAHPGLYKPAKSMHNLNLSDPRNQKFANMDWVDDPTLQGKDKKLNEQKMHNFYDYVFKALTEDAYNPVTGEKLDGIVGYELLHSSNESNPKKFEQMAEAGDRYGLYVTAGSDSHGDLHPNAIFSRVVHTRVEESAIKEKDNKVSHFAVIGCKFVEDLKKAVKEGKKLTRDVSMNVDEQITFVKNEYNKEEIITLGDFRGYIREMAANYNDSYNKGNNNGHHNNGGGKGGKGKGKGKGGKRHLEDAEADYQIESRIRQAKIEELKAMKAQLMAIKQAQQENQVEYEQDRPKTLSLTRKKRLNNVRVDEETMGFSK